MLYFALRAFGFLITNINIKITISLFFLSSSIFFHPSPCRLRSIFLPVPFSFSLSFRRICSIFSLSSRHLLHLLSLFFFLPIPVLSLSSSPPLQPAIIFLSHTHSLPSLLYFDSLILSLLSLLLICLFVPLPFSYCTSILLFSITYLRLCPSTFLFTFSLYIFSPGRLLILSFF
jgi:hypothetical protein